MKIEWILCPFCGSKTLLKIRYDTVLENFPLYCTKCKNPDYGKKTKFINHPRARRTDDNTQGKFTCDYRFFFISIYDESLPRPTGKEKNAAGQVDFVRLLCIFGRRF